ncbi:M20/M25/M40 family metallo-hydrolase [Candidatus Vidania fulgoroideorum]
MIKILNKIHIKSNIKYIYKKTKKLGYFGKVIRKNNINNLLLINTKSKKIDVAFLSHIDTVNEGDIMKWKMFPFHYNNIKKENKSLIISRGIVDMKGSLYCFLKILSKVKKKKIMIIISGDEEGKARYGARIVSKYIKRKKYILNLCLVGEPTSKNKICDTVKNGRRGSVNLKIIIRGKQGHTAYLNNINPIDYLINKFKFLTKKSKKVNFSITNININNNHYTEQRFLNITPNKLYITVNIRFSKIKYYNKIIKKIIKNTKYIKIISYIKPFYVRNNNNFFSNIKQIIRRNIVYKNYLGGTSDGRFFKFSKNLLELGLKCKYIHSINERVVEKDLKKLMYIYKSIVNIS